MQRRTVAKAVKAHGVGVHSGVAAGVVIRPGGNGIVLHRVDGRKARFELRADLVKPTPLCTFLVNEDGATLSTVEHMLAAFHGLGITDGEVEVDGPEVPILDGSALPWVRLLADCRVTLEGPAAVLRVTQDRSVVVDDRRLAAAPAEALEMDCRVDFAHPLIGPQAWRGVVSEEVFIREIAPARSFILERELKAARGAGFAKGATLEGGVLFLDDGKVANPEGLRFADEPVRHKVLDAIGDLFMAGRPVVGAFTLERPGHAANNALLREIG
jgi:UDP-3-O-[3-hydroxymyristoyl] N-acetylglucosamine deacetylase